MLVSFVLRLLVTGKEQQTTCDAEDCITGRCMSGASDQPFYLENAGLLLDAPGHRLRPTCWTNLLDQHYLMGVTTTEHGP